MCSELWSFTPTGENRFLLSLDLSRYWLPPNSRLIHQPLTWWFCVKVYSFDHSLYDTFYQDKVPVSQPVLGLLVSQSATEVGRCYWVYIRSRFFHSFITPAMRTGSLSYRCTTLHFLLFIHSHLARFHLSQKWCFILQNKRLSDKKSIIFKFELNWFVFHGSCSETEEIRVFSLVWSLSGFRSHHVWVSQKQNRSNGHTGFNSESIS